MTNHIRQLIAAAAFAAIALCGSVSFAADGEPASGRAAATGAAASRDLENASKPAEDFLRRLDAEPQFAKEISAAVQAKDPSVLAKLVDPPIGVFVKGSLVSSAADRAKDVVVDYVTICWNAGIVTICIVVPVPRALPVAK